MTEAQSQAYSLMFEGPADEQPQTLQRIKSVFIADLDLPIPQVQQILSNTPALVKAADDKESLLSAYGLLKRAGAKVLIVARSGVQEPESDLEELIGMVDLTEELTVIPQGKGHLYDRNESGADELEFEVFVGDAPSSTQRKSAGPKVYTLDLEETPDLSELSSSAEEVSEATETTSGKAEVTAREDLAAATATEDFAPPLELDESSLDDEAPVSNIEILPLGETEQTENDTASAAPQPLTLSFDEPAPPAALKAESGASNDVVKPESTPSLFEFDQPVEADKPGPAESSPRPEAAPPAVPLDLTIAEEAPTEAKESPKSAASNHPGEISAADTSPLNQIQIEPEVKATNPMPAEEPKDIVDSPAVSPVKTRPSADEADEVESAPALSKEKKKRASKVPWDIIIPISLGTLIIWYGTKTYFESQPAEDQAASERLDTALLQINEEEEETKQAEPAAPLPIYEFRKVYEDHDLVITVSLEDGKPIKGSITATTPQPPALSKEDLVAGKTPQPWLKRLESRELKFQEEAGKFIAQSPAMAYLDHQHSAKRLAGRVEAQAVFDAKSDQINFVFTIKNFEEPLKTGSGLLFEQVEDGFKVGLSAEATLTRAASEKTE